jgi:hypothetical protein
MPSPPFDIICCSWPRPVKHSHTNWESDPEWDAPPMPILPQPQWQIIDDALYWTIDWRAWFKAGLKPWDSDLGGEMRGFHVVFRLRCRADGTLTFWDDDGCLIRRNGKLVHVDRTSHALSRHAIEVCKGDELEVAQWQLGWGWMWGARLADTSSQRGMEPAAQLVPYLSEVQVRLKNPNGPPLKMYTNGHMPLRTVVALYSLILRGYVPSAVHLFGENQWSKPGRDLFRTLLPFAHVHPTADVIRHLHSLGGNRLADLARQYWFVMKMCVCLLYPPDECCAMDDDVFVLDALDDALVAFQDHDLVFAPDQNLEAGYLATWRHLNGRRPLQTARFNAGLFWLRRIDDASWLASAASRIRPNPNGAVVWEQGFIAVAYAHKRVVQLPSQRYFFPLFDGLPGGMLGYDYALNPCGFASVHFGGLIEKPSDYMALQLVPDLLEPALKTNPPSPAYD